MNDADFTTCAYCPRLCRHVCPVAVATGRESAVPATMMAAPLLLAQSVFSRADALAATSLCLGCGACTAHCKVHIPVADRLAAFRASPPPFDALAPIEGDAPLVCVVTDRSQAAWPAAWSAREGRPVAVLHTADSLGHPAWSRGDARVAPAVAAHLSGREVVTGSGAVEAVARAARLVVHRLPEPPAPERFVSCHAAPTWGPGQLACCGRRDRFPEREPEAARAVADENVRLLGGRRVSCADEECAAWLSRFGADVVGPLDPFLGDPDAR